MSARMKNKNMKIVKSALAGEKHRLEGRPCEDVVGGNQYDGFSYIALADGAGGKKLGYQTACFIIQEVDNFAKNLAEKNDPLIAVKELPDRLNNYLLNLGHPFEDMGSTFLCVFIKDNQYYIGHIGDGVILADLGEGFRVVSQPENGMFINETFFLPTQERATHYREAIGMLGESGCFILGSDGLSFTLYDSSSGEIADACNTMRGWCNDYSQKKCEQILESNLREVFDSCSDDDKSLAILTY